MKCNSFTDGVTEQLGDQPIRVLYPFIKEEFVGMRDCLHRMNQSKNFDKVKLRFLTENIKIEGPSTDGSKITLHDTFLSFLWGYIYSMLVRTPMRDKKTTHEALEEAWELRLYAIKLMNVYEEWDKDILPNPELHGKSIAEYVNITNQIFMFSIRFIFLHEFAHIYCGHPFVPIKFRNETNYHIMENDADRIATDWAIGSFAEDEVDSGRIAILLALNSIIFAQNKFNATDKHPAAEDRIISFLEKMNIDNNDFLWGIAAYSIMEWQLNNGFFYFPNKFINPKSYFQEMILELKEYKKTGFNKYKNTHI